MNHRIYAIFLLAAFIFTSVFAQPSASLAGSIVIKPAGLDHVTLEVPKNTVAGEPITIGVKVFDRHNNLITDYARSGRDLQVSVTGSASVKPQVLRATAFATGSAAFTIRDTMAEPITVTLYKDNAASPIITRVLTVRPSELEHFTLEAPGSVRAGERFDVKVTARDKFGNVVAGVRTRGSLKVKSPGTTEIKDVLFPEFVEGSSLISAVAVRTGTMNVEVIDVSTAVKGRSKDIAVGPAALERFEVTAQARAEAGVSFKATIIAYDRFGNLMYDYGNRGNGVEMRSARGDLISPSYVSPRDFRKGTATVQLSYTVAGEMTVAVVERDGTQAGRSGTVNVMPSSPSYFKVMSPDEATAGEGFRLKIEAYDRFNNLITDFSSTGADVYLSATGTGKLTPSVIKPSEFIDGAATVDVYYGRAESITISAALNKPGAERAAALPTIKPAPVAKKPALPLKPVKEEVVKAQKVFEVTDIKLVEGGPKVLVLIKVPGVDQSLEFTDERVTIDGKDWIRINLRPAENKVNRKISFVSKLIGDVRVKSAPGEFVTEVLVELKTGDVSHHVKKSKGLIIIYVQRKGV